MLEEGRGPLGSNADHSDGGADRYRDPIQVRDGLRRQRSTLSHSGDIRRPALQGLVARTSSLAYKGGRHVGRALPVELVARAERYAVVHVQDVELRHGELCKGVEPVRVPRRDGIEPADAPRTPGGRAVFMGTLAERGGFLATQLGRKGTLAHGGRIGLHDPDDTRDLARRDPGPDARAAGERIRAGHVWIDAPVEIAHRAKLPFQQDARVFGERGFDEGKRVDNAVTELRRGGENAVGHLRRIKRGVTEPLEYRVLRLELSLHARAEAPHLAHFVDLDAVAADLVRVRGPHAHAGRAALPPSALALIQTIERDVPRHDEMRAIAHAQVRGGDPAHLEIGELATEEREVDDAPGTEYANRVGIEYSTRHEMQLEGAVLVDDGVAGVVSALESDDHVRLLRQEVSDLPFALVAPLSTDDGRHRHVFECYPGCCPATRAPSFASSTRVRLRDGSLAHQRFASQSGSSAG